MLSMYFSEFVSIIFSFLESLFSVELFVVPMSTVPGSFADISVTIGSVFVLGLVLPVILMLFMPSVGK